MLSLNLGIDKEITKTKIGFKLTILGLNDGYYCQFQWNMGNFKSTILGLNILIISSVVFTLNYLKLTILSLNDYIDWLLKNAKDHFK